MDNYRKNLAWSEEDKCWIATAPDFPGMSAAGRTDTEALAELSNVLEDAVAIYEAEGWPVPVAAPPRLAEYSGQLRLRLPRSLHAQAATVAEFEQVSLNSLLVSFVAKGLGEIEMLDVVEKRLQSAAVANLSWLAPMTYYGANNFVVYLKETTATMQSELPQGATTDLLFAEPRTNPTRGRLSA